MKSYSKLIIVVASTLAFSAIGTISPAAALTNGQGSTRESRMMTATTVFKGIEVNRGRAMLSHDKMGKSVLKLSPDFVVPKSPAPHWQVVDSRGNVYLLKQLRIAGEKVNMQIEIPGYIQDVAKVQIWCSFAEVVLGEASFAKPVMTKS